VPLLLVVVLFVVGTAYLLSRPDGQPAGTAGKTTKSAPAKAAETPQAAPQPTPTIPAAPPATVPPTQRPKATTPAPTSAPTSAKAVDGFVRSYFANVTRDTGATWGQLTPAMHSAAGNRRGYDRFWRTIKRVQVNSTDVNTSGTKVVVNLTYISSRGRSTETKRLSVVNRNGRYLIDSERAG
jgi:eukaryotic-like serine/threonine-protein kinase